MYFNFLCREKYFFLIVYYVGECLRLTVHFGTILAHSDQPTTPTSEVNILELIGKFEEFFVKQGQILI